MVLPYYMIKLPRSINIAVKRRCMTIFPTISPEITQVFIDKRRHPSRTLALKIGFWILKAYGYACKLGVMP